MELQGIYITHRTAYGTTYRITLLGGIEPLKDGTYQAEAFLHESLQKRYDPNLLLHGIENVAQELMHTVHTTEVRPLASDEPDMWGTEARAWGTILLTSDEYAHLATLEAAYEQTMQSYKEAEEELQNLLQNPTSDDPQEAKRLLYAAEDMVTAYSMKLQEPQHIELS